MKLVITTFLLPILFALSSPRAPAGGETDVLTGTIENAAYRIQIPQNWNRGLLMYAHGYRPRGGTWFPLNAGFSSIFLDRGFAVAESGYSRQGWALEEAVRDIEALRRFFAKKKGEPRVTFIAGHSMGGIISLATIEMHPDAYDGALPLCGPLVPALCFFKNHIFDLLVTFEAHFGKSLPEELRPVVDAPALPVAAVKSALDADPALATRFAHQWDMREEDVPAIIAQYHMILREVIDRAGGNPIDNRNSVYSGFGTIEGLNAAVPRYCADAKARDYLRRHYTPTGLVEDPVLAVHTRYDPGVPPRLGNQYDLTLSLTGRQEWFVQKFVEADGHCNISPELTGKAFDLLRKWAVEGARPAPGVLQ